MQYALLALGMDAAAFLMADRDLQMLTKSILLFGSVAAGEADEESDVDLFIEADEQYELAFRQRYHLWSLSSRAEVWRAQGIQQEVSLHIGQVEKWKNVHRSAISNGIVLYGKYSAVPEKLSQFALVTFTVPNARAATAVRCWRKLYGYKQKTKRKVYSMPGIASKLRLIRIKPGALLVPAQKLNELVAFFKGNKISYGVRDVWMD